MSILKIIKKIKSWNIPKYVVVKALLEPMSQKLAKTTIVANFRQLSVNTFTATLTFLVDLINLVYVSNFIIH